MLLDEQQKELEDQKQQGQGGGSRRSSIEHEGNGEHETEAWSMEEIVTVDRDDGKDALAATRMENSSHRLHCRWVSRKTQGAAPIEEPRLLQTFVDCRALPLL